MRFRICYFIFILESQSAKETLHLEEEEQISVAEDDMLPIKKASSGQSENVLSRIAAFEQNHQKDSSNTPVVEPKSKFVFYFFEIWRAIIEI